MRLLVDRRQLCRHWGSCVSLLGGDVITTSIIYGCPSLAVPSVRESPPAKATANPVAKAGASWRISVEGASVLKRLFRRPSRHNAVRPAFKPRVSVRVGVQRGRAGRRARAGGNGLTCQRAGCRRAGGRSSARPAVEQTGVSVEDGRAGGRSTTRRAVTVLLCFIQCAPDAPFVPVCPRDLPQCGQHHLTILVRHSRLFLSGSVVARAAARSPLGCALLLGALAFHSLTRVWRFMRVCICMCASLFACWHISVIQLFVGVGV